MLATCHLLLVTVIQSNIIMPKRILILGAGFGGLETANSLSEKMGADYNITLIDKSNSFFIGFSKFDVMFKRKTEEEIKYPYAKIKNPNVHFVQDTITDIDIENKMVSTIESQFLYDYLIIALGADLDLGAIPGFIQSGSHEFYSLQGARMLRKKLEEFERGNIVLSIFSKPYKCPPAPFEGILQIHDFFKEKGLLDKVTLKMVIPAPKPLPVSNDVSDRIVRLLKEKNIELITNTKIIRVEFSQKIALAENGTPIPYDLFIGVPIHVAPLVVQESDLGSEGFIPVSPDNLETKVANVYAIGDVNKIPAGNEAVAKAGVFAEDGAKTVVADILQKEGIEKGKRKFEAAGSCFFEFGEGKVAKVKANFLGGDKPQVTFDTSSEDFAEDKINFVEDRKKRWFNL